jgi:hypothetical protein
MAHAVSTSDLTTEQRLAGAYLTVALLALFVGVVTGLLQAFSTSGVNIYNELAPVVKSYSPLRKGHSRF